MLNDLLAKVGEKIEVRRFSVLQAGDGISARTLMSAARIGVLVECSGMDQSGRRRVPGGTWRCRIAAMNPLVVGRDDVARETIERELESIERNRRTKGSRTHSGEIAQGKLEKFYQEVCLLEQIYIKDPAKTIKSFLEMSERRSEAP